MSDIKLEDYEPINLAALDRRDLIHKIRSLITTIESQQEKISELEMEMVLTERVVTRKKAMLKDVEKRMSEVIDSRDKAMDEIESLKALTELAVKSLKSIVDHTGPKTGEDAWEMFQEAEYTLSEIERLQNEKP